MEKKLEKITFALWEEAYRQFPSPTRSGDVDPFLVAKLDDAIRMCIKDWLKNDERELKLMINKKIFDEFKEIQESGKYNMMDSRVRQILGLDKKTFFYLLENYDNFEKLWGKKK